MLTRTNELGSQDKYYSDSLLTAPSLSRSVYDNLAIGVATPNIALNDLNKQFGETAEGKAIHSLYDTVQLENQNAGWGQWIANEGANMIGMALNPLTWGLGGLGELGGAAVAKGVAQVGSKALPDSATVLMRSPLIKGESVATIGTKAAEAFGAGAGAGVPQGIEENRDKDTGNINWGGVAKSAGEMGAMGVAIGSVPYAWGILKGKVNRALNEAPNAEVTPSKIDQALDNKQITPDEHQWYKDYEEHLKNPEDKKVLEDLQQRATQIINKNGHEVNFATNEAQFKFLDENDMHNLQGAIADQAVADVPDEFKNTLSDYIIQNRLDKLSENPTMLDGLKGYSEFVGKKLEQKELKLAEEDKILDDHMLKGMKDNMDFSQKELMKFIKKSQFEKSQLDQLPLVMPDEIKLHKNLLDKISKLNAKIKKFGSNKQTEKRIAELEAKLPKILTPKEELKQIREKLITKDGLKKNFELSPEYHRLLDLSNVWKNAKTLLDRIHVEHEYNKQEAFKTLADHVIKVSESNLGKIAKPENVVSYLKKRIEGNFEKRKPINEIKSEVEQQQKIPSNPDEVLSEQEQQFKDTQAEDAKKEFTKSLDQFKEFKSSENIFKNLLQCVMGALNV